jgi:hypothetical protein
VSFRAQVRLLMVLMIIVFLTAWAVSFIFGDDPLTENIGYLIGSIAFIGIFLFIYLGMKD